MSTQRIPGFCALCRSRGGRIALVADGRLVAVEADPEWAARTVSRPARP